MSKPSYPIRAIHEPALVNSWRHIWESGWRFQHSDGPRLVGRWCILTALAAGLLLHLT